MKISLRRNHSQWVRDGTSSHEIDYVLTILNLEEHKNCIIVSEVTAILLNGRILPIGGVALKRVCTSSRRSRLAFGEKKEMRLWRQISAMTLVSRLQVSPPGLPISCVKDNHGQNNKNSIFLWNML